MKARLLGTLNHNSLRKDFMRSRDQEREFSHTLERLVDLFSRNTCLIHQLFGRVAAVEQKQNPPPDVVVEIHRNMPERCNSVPGANL